MYLRGLRAEKNREDQRPGLCCMMQMVRDNITMGSGKKQTSLDAYHEKTLRKQNLSHELRSVSEK